MRFTDMGLSMPTTLAALVIAALLPGGILRVLVIITALFWAYPARLIYGEVLRLRHRAFVEAAEAAGARSTTVMRRHLLPHLSPLMITYFPLNAVSAVLFEAGISFLGAGVNPPTPSWGNMISDGESAIVYAPHLLIEPAICILLTTMAFVLIGEGLKATEPGSREGVVARRLMVRLGLAAVSVLGVIVLTFILTYVIPGDPARQLAPRAPTAAVLESIRVQLHLDRPLMRAVRRLRGRALRGDLGTSYVQREQVSTLILQRLPATIMLALRRRAVRDGPRLGDRRSSRP